MDHSAVEMLLEDWIEGRLPRERAAEVEVHVRGCAECTMHADLMRSVRREVAAHGEALLTPHPSSDELARLELRVESFAPADAARLGAHVRACPTCAAERRMIRAAARPAPLRTLAAWYAEPSRHDAWLRPVLAVAVVLLAWPAWLGLVEYPRARRAAEAAHDAVRRVESRSEAESPAAGGAPSGGITGAGARGWRGGGAGVLILSGATRGPGAAVPAVRLRPDQPSVTIVADRRLTGRGPVRIILRNAAGTVIWETASSADELWDKEAGVTSLMIPASALAPGEYSLAIVPESGPPSFEARFRSLK